MNSFISAVARPVCLLALILAAGLAVPAQAGPGHEGGHDGEAAAVVTGGPVQPRFEAHSDLFEVVADIRQDELTLTLDRYATNEPVPHAQIEIESGSYKATGEYVPDAARYRFRGTPFAAPGAYPVTLTIAAGDDIDLLAADLVVAPAAAPAATAAPASNRRLLWGAGGAALVLALVFGLRRRRSPAARETRTEHH